MPTQINFASSIITQRTYTLEDNFSCIKIDWQKARERELATFDENRRAVGMLNPVRDRNQSAGPGRRDDTSDHGLSRRSLEVKPPKS